MAHKVAFSPEAQTDLIDLYDDVAERSSPERAISYIERIEAICHGLETFPHRGAGS